MLLSALNSDASQAKPEAKYVFEYNFFNQLTVRLTKEQLRLAYIVLGVSLLVLLILMQVGFSRPKRLTRANS